jgi:7-carboxy-7-deazaguanine synthase
MKIAEIFYSIQGEGSLTGVPSAFVRTSGCNLRCTWCDTPYTSWQPEGEAMSVSEIVERVAAYPTRHAVITGGEPLLMPDLDELCRALRTRGYHITVETAATIFKPLACDLASLSPKLSNSTPRDRDAGHWADQHDALRLRLDVIRAFMQHCDYQLKFVIERPSDLDEVHAILDQLAGVDRGKVLLMPQALTRADLAERGPWLAEACKEHGFRYCPRLHIELYGNQRGT